MTTGSLRGSLSLLPWVSVGSHAQLNQHEQKCQDHFTDLLRYIQLEEITTQMTNNKNDTVPVYIIFI